MFKKKKIEKKQNIFTISSEEAKKYLSSITNDVYTIIKNDKFLEATKKVNLPENATIKDYERLIKNTIPSKIYNFMMLFIDDCYDEVRRILSAIFVTNFDEYKNKSIQEMCEDIASLNIEEISKIINFFLH